MRKRIIVLLSILLAIVLMGCGEDTAAASADTDSIESAISNAWQMKFRFYLFLFLIRTVNTRWTFP